MSRRNSGILEDLMDIAAKFPWWVGVGLAVLAYVLLHAYSTERPVAPTNPKEFSNHMTRQVFWGLAYAGQYLVPLAFVLGAMTSAIRGQKQKKLHHQTAKLGKRSALFEMSWQEFEGLVCESYRQQGFSVMEKGGSQPDGGVDLVLKKGGEKYLVQCKQWRARSVGVPVVRELLGAIAAEGAVGGYVVTAGVFTVEAKEFAKGRNITLVDGDRLMIQIRGISKVRKHMEAPSMKAGLAPDCPKCGTAMVKRQAKQGAKAGQYFWGCSKFPKCSGIRSLA